MGFHTLIYERKGALATVTLNRPDALNAYSIQMRDDLYEVLSAIKSDDEIRAVILKGTGDKAFCAGADLSEFITAPPPVDARRVRFQRDVWNLFLGMPQPFVAALHGYALGSGIEMSLCCDIRIASRDTKFGLPEGALGIIPAAGGTQTLPRAIGRSRAMEMLLTHRWIDANEALAAGLLNEVVDREKLLERACAIAERIASAAPGAVRLIKQAVRRGMDMPLAEGLEMERRMAKMLYFG